MRRHHVIARAADQLLAHRAALTADPEEESDFWLDQAQAVLDYGCPCAASPARVHTCPLTALGVEEHRNEKPVLALSVMIRRR